MCTTVDGVVLQVVEVHEGCLAEVVVGELEVPHFSGDHRLRAGRQRRVADGQSLVVGEVARLLLVGEGIAARVQREHEVGLLHDLLAVQVEVGIVEQQRVLRGVGAGEVPGLMVGEALRLRVDPEGLVPRDDHVLGRVPPCRRLLEVGTESGGVPRMAPDGLGRRAQVPLSHQVGVDVVVGDRAVLIGAGDAVDAEEALRVVVSERAPEARRLHEQLEP